jgi:hypothetical protein
MQDKLHFTGLITAVKPRIRLMRSFDQKHHTYMGYVLVLNAQVDDNEWNDLRVALGQKTHEKHQFRIGDKISGEAHHIVNSETEWADLYKVSKLKVISRGGLDQDMLGNQYIGLAPSLTVFREQGHVRLDSKTYEAKCRQCIWGLVMPVEIIVDQWNPQEKKYRFETHCYGPRDCPTYKSGRPYRVPGRRGMSWIDDDIERERSGEY